MATISERLRNGTTDGTDLRWSVTPIHVEAADTIDALVAALEGSRETILQLVNARGSEAEGTDEEWVAEIDAAIARAKG